MMVPASFGAILDVPATFDTDEEGWTGIDWSTFGYDASGNPGGSLEGYMEDNSFFPQTAIFRINSGSFTGDYAGAGAINFDLFADDIHPSSISIVLSGAGGDFIWSANVSSSVDLWVSYTAPLTLSAWSGGNQTDFDNTLGDVSYLEIQIVSRDQDPQTYFLDNVELSSSFEGGGVVPEPQNLLLLAFIIVGILMRRRILEHLNRSTKPRKEAPA